MNKRKSTMVELVEELSALNTNGQYDTLIENAKSGRYHDYKNPPDVVCGKIELVAELTHYPELAEIRNKVLNGEYDEEADEKDKEELRKDLPKNMWPMFGL